MVEPRKQRGPAVTPGPAKNHHRHHQASSSRVSITRLADVRHRRLLAPWPGWWGDAEVRSWTWAERSRRAL